MNNVEFKIKYLEEKIYQDEKDGGCNYANDLRRKYPEYIDLVDISKIFIRIVNYRVKKYGTSRIGYSSWDDTTYDEVLKEHKRRYFKKRNEAIK